MNGVDGSDHYERSNTEDAPSLLAIVLDTNPHAWATLEEKLPLSKAIANILVFINAHLSFNNANQVAVVASHTRHAAWLYPRPPTISSGEGDIKMTGDDTSSNEQNHQANNVNKYRPFALIEHDILTSVRDLNSTTTENDLSASATTQMAGALTLALAFINKASIAYSGPTIEADDKQTSDLKDGGTSDAPTGLRSRIFVLSVSGDLAHQYIPIMNATFAAQSKRIPIDILKLAGDTVFLQQACDATEGIYMQPQNPQGLLQYLMVAFLPDQATREHMVAPTQEMVDFRAACFCHRRVVDIGFVCSICLSIFCSPPEGAICLTCGTHLALGEYGGKPAVIPRKKKKKKRLNGVESGSRRGTPAPG